MKILKEANFGCLTSKYPQDFALVSQQMKNLSLKVCLKHCLILKGCCMMLSEASFRSLVVVITYSIGTSSWTSSIIHLLRSFTVKRFHWWFKDVPTFQYLCPFLSLESHWFSTDKKSWWMNWTQFFVSFTFALLFVW